MADRVIVIKEEELRSLLSRPDVRNAMEIRCAEQGHDWENCCTVFLGVYQRCKWCGQER